MNYNKNTVTPIGDAALFFSSINGDVRYEEKPRDYEKRKIASEIPKYSVDRFAKKLRDGALRMEHL